MHSPKNRTRQSARHLPLSDNQAPPPAIPAESDDQVLTIRQWAALAGFSVRTARRELAGKDGPKVTRLSARRIGISRGNHRLWLASRTKRR
jgi:hypothetical protein